MLSLGGQFDHSPLAHVLDLHTRRQGLYVRSRLGFSAMPEARLAHGLNGVEDPSSRAAAEELRPHHRLPRS